MVSVKQFRKHTCDDTVKACQEFFSFELPSDQLTKHTHTFI